MTPKLLLARAAAVLMLTGLLTGAATGLAMMDTIPGDAQILLGAHLAALMGSFFCVGVAWTLPMLGFAEAWKSRLAWLTVLGNAANWLITTVKSFFGVHGVGLTGETANDVVFVMLNLFVVVPMLGAAVLWVVGLFRPTPTPG